MTPAYSPRDAEWAEVEAEGHARDRIARRPRPLGTITVAPAPPVAELLAFEGEHPGNSGAKQEHIRQRFDGMTGARYYQLLNAAIDTKEALTIDPVLVNRLRRIRDDHHTARAARMSALIDWRTT